MAKKQGTIHQRVYVELDKLIKKHYWDEDYILPSEKFFCEKYGVSRNSVRRAFFELEKDGRIRRYRGKGTVINREPQSSERSTPLQILFILTDYDPLDDYQGQIVNAAMRAVTRLGGEVRIELMNNHQDSDLAAFRNQQGKQLDGVLYYPSFHADGKDVSQQLKTTIELLEVPVVFMDHGLILENGEVFHTGLVISDNYYMVKAATQRLLQAGHTRIGYLTHSDETLNSGLVERNEGYSDALREAGLEPQPFALDTHEPDANKQAATTICNKVNEGALTSMVCSYNLIATWLLDQCRTNQIAIPEALSIVCASRVHSPYQVAPMAMIDQKAETIGDAAAELLFRQIRAKGPREKETIRISSDFIENNAIQTPVKQPIVQS